VFDTVGCVRIHKALDVLQIDSDNLVVVSALQETPAYVPDRSLRDRVLERVSQLYRPDAQGGSSNLQLVVASSPLAGPNALTLAAVSYIWLPAVQSAQVYPMDLVSMAYALWSPDSPSSRFARFEVCMKTVLRLTSTSPKVGSQPSMS
jgi:hypothetical protein